MKVELTKEAYSMLQNNQILTHIALLSGIHYPSLYRWVKTKHENLTLYRVLYSFSRVVGKNIDELVKIREE